MIYVLLGAFIALAIIAYIRNNEDACFGSWVGGIIVGAIILLALLVNGMDLAKSEAFYYANTQNYEITVDETASYLSSNELRDALISGSIEKFKLTDSVSARIAEWRDAVNAYNKRIALMQYFNRNWFVGVLVPNGVDDLKLLIIK